MAATLADRTVSFDDALASVQNLVQASRINPRPRPTDFGQIKTFVISFNIFLREVLPYASAEALREIRIGILRIVTKRNGVDSTYDLPLNEIQAIKDYFFRGGGVTKEGRIVIEGLAQILEGVDLQQ